MPRVPMSDEPVLAALTRLEAGQAQLQAEFFRTRTDLMERMDRLQTACVTTWR